MKQVKYKDMFLDEHFVSLIIVLN